MASRQPLAIADCAECKKMNNREIRQALGCGYEPPVERVATWRPPSGAAGYRGEPPTVCPGYTTKLPEVIETAIERVHWSKGSAPNDLTEETRLSLVILDGAYNQLQRWMMTPIADGGGRE